MSLHEVGMYSLGILQVQKILSLMHLIYRSTYEIEFETNWRIVGTVF